MPVNGRDNDALDLRLLSWLGHSYIPSMAEPDLTDNDKAIVVELIRDAIERDRFPLSTHSRSLQVILAKLDPSAALEARKPRRASGPITLGSIVENQMHLVAWCQICGQQSRADPAEEMARHGAELPIEEWRRQFVCSRCGDRATPLR
jgi:hypothetical protein